MAMSCETSTCNDSMVADFLPTVGQRNYFTTSVTVLYKLPLVAVLFYTGNNKAIFRTLRQNQIHTLQHMVTHVSRQRKGSTALKMGLLPATFALS